jgi:hypothetical protein
MKKEWNSPMRSPALSGKYKDSAQDKRLPIVKEPKLSVSASVSQHLEAGRQLGATVVYRNKTLLKINGKY